MKLNAARRLYSTATIPLLLLLPSTVRAGPEGRLPTIFGGGGGPSQRIASARDEVCWSEPVDLSDTRISSEIMDAFGIESEVANDFVINYNALVTKAIGYGGYYNWAPSDPPITSLNWRFYDDAGCVPGALLSTFMGLGTETFIGFDNYGFPTYRYELSVSQAVNGGEIYWLGLQAADHPFPPQWGRQGTGGIVMNCETVFKSAFFAYPNWTPAGDVVGRSFDAAQEFVCVPDSSGVTGACCFADGRCEIRSPAGCPPGVYRGDNTACDSTTCGACCYYDTRPDVNDWACFPADRKVTCVQRNRGFFLSGRGCDPDPCAGACCLRDEPGRCCRILREKPCLQRKGYWKDPGTTCEGNQRGELDSFTPMFGADRATDTWVFKYRNPGHDDACWDDVWVVDYCLQTCRKDVGWESHIEQTSALHCVKNAFPGTDEYIGVVGPLVKREKDVYRFGAQARLRHRGTPMGPRRGFPLKYSARWDLDFKLGVDLDGDLRDLIKKGAIPVKAGLTIGQQKNLSCLADPSDCGLPPPLSGGREQLTEPRPTAVEWRYSVIATFPDSGYVTDRFTYSDNRNWSRFLAERDWVTFTDGDSVLSLDSDSDSLSVSLTIPESAEVDTLILGLRAWQYVDGVRDSLPIDRFAFWLPPVVTESVPVPYGVVASMGDPVSMTVATGLIPSSMDESRSGLMAELGPLGRGGVVAIADSGHSSTVTFIQSRPIIAGERCRALVTGSLVEARGSEIQTGLGMEFVGSSGTALFDSVTGYRTEHLSEPILQGAGEILPFLRVGDQRPWIVAAPSELGRELRFVRNGEAGLQLGMTVAVPSPGPVHIATLDADYDGDQDVLAACEGGEGWSLVIQGPGDQWSLQTETVPANPTHAFAADIDNDGVQDVVLASRDGLQSRVFVLLNKGALAFEEDSVLVVPGAIAALSAGDVNRDGRVDLVAVVGGATSSVQVFYNLYQTHTGSYWYGHLTANYSVDPSGLDLWDVNDDAWLDAVVVLADGSARILLNDEHGVLAESQDLIVGGDPRRVRIVDVDGDRDPDILVGSHTDGTVRVLRNAGGGSFSGADHLRFDLGSELGGLLACDLDENGIVDIMASLQGAYGIVWLGAPCPATGALTVAREQKISDTQGGFGGLLDQDAFGRSVAHLGDLDGDGVSDIAVGASGAIRGAVHILFLHADGTVKSSTRIDPSSLPGNCAPPSSDFGTGVASLGDIDGVGGSAHALAVGVPWDDDGGPDRGAVHILFLDAGGQVLSCQKISSQAGELQGPLHDHDWFGWSVRGLGDLDGDTIPDLAVGAVLDDDGGGGDRGAVWILFLNRDGTVRDEQKISATAGGFAGVLEPGTGFGNGLARLDDYDRDGTPELAVAAHTDDDDAGCGDCGAVWVLFLDADGTVHAHQRISATDGGLGEGTLDPGDYFGSGIGSAGDMNGDGIEDLLVGAYGDDGGGQESGAVWLLLMNADGSVRCTQKVGEGSGGFDGQLDPSDQFGTSIAGLADLDGDNLMDFAVGARFDDDGGDNRGAVWLLFSSDFVSSVATPQPPARRETLLAIPNPFSATTVFRTEGAEGGRIEIFDAAGRRMRTLVVSSANGARGGSVTWDGRDESDTALPAGIYFAKWTAPGRSRAVTVILTR